MSKLIYLMPLWAGCEEYLVNYLQGIQNKAAWSVAHLSIFTPTNWRKRALQLPICRNNEGFCGKPQFLPQSVTKLLLAQYLFCFTDNKGLGLRPILLFF